MRAAQRGYTIIELLVVITIIAILATVILTSLNDARQEGINAKIRAEMDFVAKRAEVGHVKSLTYDSVCGSNGFATSSEIVDIIASINHLASSTVTCRSDTAAYAVSVPIDTAHWCIDSGGIRKEIPNALAPGQTACP